MFVEHINTSDVQLSKENREHGRGTFDECKPTLSYIKIKPEIKDHPRITPLGDQRLHACTVLFGGGGDSGHLGITTRI